MSKCQVKLKIADIIIHIKSRFPLERLSKRELKWQAPERFKTFFYKGRASPDINIEVNIVDRVPKIKGAKEIFASYNPDRREENWRLFKRGHHYVYKTPRSKHSNMISGKSQVSLINENFNKVVVNLPPHYERGEVWNVQDIIYDFLQVLLINHFALHKKGIFLHSFGIKDINGKGLIFAGKTESGKTTMARIWHKFSKAMVLNDDRMIVRKINGKFFIFGSPWHGDFGDYLVSRIESAPLEKMFFIYHSRKNIIKKVSIKKAFRLLYPAVFPTFWDKACLDNLVPIYQELVEKIPCYKFGFRKDKRIINFVRNFSQ
jgi:hypothetical protein